MRWASVIGTGRSAAAGGTVCGIGGNEGGNDCGGGAVSNPPGSARTGPSPGQQPPPGQQPISVPSTTRSRSRRKGPVSREVNELPEQLVQPEGAEQPQASPRAAARATRNIRARTMTRFLYARRVGGVQTGAPDGIGSASTPVRQSCARKLEPSNRPTA